MAHQDIQSPTDTCNTCRFWRRDPEAFGFAAPQSISGTLGRCHRHAPRGPATVRNLSDYAYLPFPPVGGKAWCGEHEPVAAVPVEHEPQVTVSEPGPRDDFMREIVWKERKQYQTFPTVGLSCGHEIEGTCVANVIGETVRCNQCRDGATAQSDRK